MSYIDVIAIAIAYLAGSISFAILLCRLSGKRDPRQLGSGNPGATNMVQVGGKKLAALTLVGDIVKSFLPIAVAVQYGLAEMTIALMCLASIAGHLYPIFHRFRGGKGVASFLGVLLAAKPEAGVVWLGVWLLTAGVFRYSSLAGITACASAPLVIFILAYPQEKALLVVNAIIALFVVVRHRSNIKRLRSGTEAKIFGH